MWRSELLANIVFFSAYFSWMELTVLHYFSMYMLHDMTRFALPNRWSQGTRTLGQPLASYQSTEISQNAFIIKITFLSVIKQNKF